MSTDAVNTEAVVLRGRGATAGRALLRSPGALTGLALIAGLFVLAYAGPYMTNWNYTDIDYTALRSAPGARHWMGTSRIGQDVFAQTVRGLQKSLLIGALVALASTALGAAFGTCAGYFGGWVDRMLMFVVDLMLVIPGFLLLVLLVPRLRGLGWPAFAGLLAALGWMITARAVRIMTLSLRERPFVAAAQHMGVGPFRIIVRHVLPHLASFLITDATVAVAAAVISETGLSYFGFGVQPPDVSLGTLIASGSDVALTCPWMFFFPAGLLLLFVLAVHLAGDALRDILDLGSDRAGSLR
ncbi:ABC transporter permease [Streptomyces violascens]|uniref:Oligopeptide transport system permease protein OppC n=1 Tax=Streptomyces violascens TaxID=67381 RepID=A0ABQ3QWD4_9ACTN|nr:ABC transporter permease [Streptomyces violascens]GGU27965.1 putative peptide transport permease protein [Streptomyces violascens]GHI41524.1 putative peptide transport permease protein [Streptomyces violascens]